MGKTVGQKRWVEYGYIVIGVILYVLAVNVFFSPNHIVTGGITGIAIVLQALTEPMIPGGIPISVTNIVLNLPLFYLAHRVLRGEYFRRTVAATVASSILMEVLSFVPVYEGDYLLAALYGGIISGISTGLMLRGFCTAGGSDLLSTIIHHLKPHLPVSMVIFAVNAGIILAGFVVFGAQAAMYGILAVFFISKAVDLVLEGLSFSKVALIISDHNQEIARLLMDKQKRAVTGLHGTGMYTGEEKNVLLYVFRQKEITVMKQIVRSVDPKAFLIISDAKDVLGNGFKNLEDED
ncbi:MAG TPA: YitT family protein [Firmicutes bacterium]|nr:YitT family protein [Bacillota bacterium]